MDGLDYRRPVCGTPGTRGVSGVGIGHYRSDDDRFYASFFLLLYSISQRAARAVFVDDVRRIFPGIALQGNGNCTSADRWRLRTVLFLGCGASQAEDRSRDYSFKSLS